jgi:hypothetical protein
VKGKCVENLVRNSVKEDGEKIEMFLTEMSWENRKWMELALDHV